MVFWKSIDGVLEVELTSGDPASSLMAITAESIQLHSVHYISDLTCSFHIRRKDHIRTDMLCQKRGESLKIVKRIGLYWYIKELMARPVMIIGMMVLLLMTIYLPTKVLFVCVEGNEQVPTNRILSAAESCGICFGTSRRIVRSEKVKNSLLASIPELQWAGVNTHGCVASISVRERTDNEENEPPKQVTSIVANRDGYILSATVTEGNALVQPGQTVKEGQVLVSGFTDCGICIQATESKGEIFAQTSRRFLAVSPCQRMIRKEARSITQNYSIILGKKRINLWKDSGISDTSCGRMYKEYYLTLPGDFQLPIAIGIEQITCYSTQEAEVTPHTLESELNRFVNSYLDNHMIAGKIIQREETLKSQNGIYLFTGQYVCTEMIGRVRQERLEK